MLCRSPFALGELELASGIVFGRRTIRGSSAPPAGAPEPLGALDDVLRCALLEPPCVVSFSGGRDSSAVLAAAVRVARREGLPLPVPATNVFENAGAAAETHWQESVIRHLGLDEWVRLESDGELDCIGPVARSVLRRHGLLWPFNAHFHAPLLALARGGTLLTGIGGDELLGASQWARAAEVLARRARPEPRDLLRVPVGFAPTRLRAWALRRRSPGTLPWLTPAGKAALLEAWAADVARQPLRWSRRWRWWHSLRQVEVGLASLDLIASDYQARILHPLTDPGFATASARRLSAAQIYDRAAAMRLLFGEILPRGILERSSKATFDEVFWGADSRRLAPVLLESVEDGFLAPVDRDALRRTWTEVRPDGHSYLLLQALWLRVNEGQDLVVGSVVHGQDHD